MAKGMPNNLRALGFMDAEATVTPRLIASISGLEKQGKTHFALTAPGPVAVFNLDIGIEGVVSKFKTEGKEVVVYDMVIPNGADDAEKVWGSFMQAYKTVLKDRWVRTVVWDTATECWELLRLARFGKLTQVMPYHYGPVNAEFRRMLRAAYDSDKNLLLLHKMKPMYINDKRTKDYERAGFGDTGFLVQVNAQVYREEPDAEEGDTGEFHVYVKDCRQNPDMAGMDLAGPLCSFPMMAGMVLPDVPAAMWE